MGRLRGPFVAVALAVSPLAGCHPAPQVREPDVRAAVLATGRLPRGELVVTVEARDGARSASFTWSVPIGNGRWLDDDPTGVLLAVQGAPAPESLGPGRVRVPVDLRGEPGVATVEAGATVQRVTVELAGDGDGVVGLTLEVRSH